MQWCIRLAAYLWPLPYTLIGIACGLLLGGRFQCVNGVIEIHGHSIAGVLKRFPGPAVAITLGHVVLGRNENMLQVTRRHERVHVGQYERWGLAFIPTYLLVSVSLYFLGRDGYRDNPFERAAYAVDEAAWPKVSGLQERPE